MNKILIWLLILLNINILAQIEFVELNDVPDSFKIKYYSKQRNYNPLQVGNVWQYSNGHLEFINKDTLINGVTYYKREFPNYILWDVYTLERNDQVSGASYLFDILDLDRDGDVNEELLLDSLDVTNFTEYFSYKHITEFRVVIGGDPPPYVSLIKDSSWAIVFNDTVMTRFVEYHCCFTGEIVADKYGIIWSMTESDPYILTGAIIDGKEYGKIVKVNDEISLPLKDEFSLSQNYPNPFNAETNIEFNIPSAGAIQIRIFNVLGQIVKIIVDENKSPGKHNIKFNGYSLPSGIYYYTILYENEKITNSMLLLK